MVSVWYYFFAGLLAFLVGLYGTPIARTAALRFGVVDAPDGNLKMHHTAIPYLGGLAIYLAVLVPLCLFYTNFDRSLLSILLAATLVLMLGLIDDFGVLTPAAKFIGQIIAAVVLVKGDILIRVESFHPYLNLLLTMIWIIGMTNAFNIIDIMDGLAAGIALMSAIALFIVALINHHAMIAMMAVTLIGSLAGFLPYNFRPAKIYMGDTGSMFLGLTLGALAIICDYSAHNGLAFFNPLLLFGVAIFDTAYVMILRSLRKKSMFLGSKDHFALRLKSLGWSTTKIVIASYLVAASLGACALLNMYLPFQGSIYLYSFVALFFLMLGWRLAQVKVE